METRSPSTVEIPQFRAGLIRAGFRSLSAWARARRVNYNTAWAVLHGRRHGPTAKKVLRQLRKDARAL